MEYKYQLHCHTVPCSHCSHMTPEQLVQTLAEGGYAGACVTNHFLNGNTGIDRNLPWNEFVSAYEKDWELCVRAAEGTGVRIFFAVEEHFGGGQEVLCYGLTPRMLYDHPELKKRDAKLWYETLSPLGCLMIQAHPFRDREYNEIIGVLPHGVIDGIEVFNFCNSENANTRAMQYACENPDLITISGADAHTTEKLCISGIKTNKEITSGKELVSVLKHREYEMIFTLR